VKRFALVLGLGVCAAAAGEEPPDLGSIRFLNSGSEGAQAPFVRGMLLLHSFEFEDAREAFLEAERADPGFALAYWGEALTHNHPLWREQDADAARAALAKLAPTPAARRAKAPTERERGYLAAVDALYGEGDKVARDRAYAEAMRGLSERYPDDLEARALWALAILGTAQGVRDYAVYMSAAAVAEEVFAANPRHPGAAHYLIHSYDDPIHAPLGLRAARTYARIAPATSHAQHMISHIYVALGWWDDSVQSNVNAVDVSVERRARKGLGPDALNYHALHWLVYSYLQLGRYDDARAAMQRMVGYAEESGSGRALWHLAAVRAAWIVETGGRDAPQEVESEKTQVTGAAADAFATGYAAILRGDREAAERAAARLADRHATASHGPLCHQTGAYSDVSKGDLVVVAVLRDLLRARIEQAAGHTERALELLDTATAAEDALPVDFGPPAIVKPSHEMYGDMLLELGRPAEARAQYEKALARAPRRSLALAGVARAATALDDKAAVADACEQIARNYARADTSVPRPAPCSEPPTVAAGR
jgi:tetratricopeptide (TPR) repeat protein